jgi:hypothetical protein
MATCSKCNRPAAHISASGHFLELSHLNTILNSNHQPDFILVLSAGAALLIKMTLGTRYLEEILRLRLTIMT